MLIVHIYPVLIYDYYPSYIWSNDTTFRNCCSTCTCLSVFVAVKFGRMSKRQREMVQDEVKYHKKVRSTSSDSGSDTDMSIMEM